MPLSTSSFDREIPRHPWLRMVLLALLICVTFIILLEWSLMRKGVRNTVLDSSALWSQERSCAARLGSRALMIIGGSRAQLALDLPSLRDQLPLEPVQLAVDGSSWYSILEGLAEDEAIRGVVLVDYYDHIVEIGESQDLATQYLLDYQQQQKHSLGWAVALDQFFERHLRSHLRSYADGARPLRSLIERVLNPNPTSQYLTTFPDRSRSADYQKVEMPQFYNQRVMRNLNLKGDPGSISDEELNQLVQEKIAQIQERAVDTSRFLEHTQLVKEWVAQIRKRGGEVFFVRMPVSGHVRTQIEAAYPRHHFADQFEREADVALIDFRDDPIMSQIDCPDGSHLDYRDKKRFTQALINRIKEENLIH